MAGLRHSGTEPGSRWPGHFVARRRPLAIRTAVRTESPSPLRAGADPGGSRPRGRLQPAPLRIWGEVGAGTRQLPAAWRAAGDSGGGVGGYAKLRVRPTPLGAAAAEA